MSCYVVDPAHLDALVYAALRADWYGRRVAFDAVVVTETTADAVGRALLEENLASVRSRYPGRPDAALPGPVPMPVVADHRFVFPVHELTPVELIKAVDGYVYQACEHDGWEASAARRFCDALRRSAIERLPGYDAARWRIEAASRPVDPPATDDDLDDAA